MKKDVHMLHLGFSKTEIERYKSNKVAYNMLINSFVKKSKLEAKRTHCICCGKECSSFCNSHSIPKFCLKNISLNGYLYYSGNLIDIPLFEREKGLNEAGTFKLICRECDSQIFCDYENPNNYSNNPTDKMLSQIAMKNYLKNIAKRELEIVLYKNLEKEIDSELSILQFINRLDLNEYIKEFSYAKKASQSKWNDYYFINYFEILDYVVPLAFQSSIALVADFEGNVINNIYNASPDYKLSDLHLCVFPLKDKSIIICFTKNGDKRYRNFFKQFRKLSKDEKLKAINYIIFSYSEDVFLYKGLDYDILQNKALKNVAKKTTIAVADNPFANSLAKAIENFSFNEMQKIPNLLDEKYKIVYKNNEGNECLNKLQRS
ncbi:MULTISPECIES: hypothetical protein [Brevibacillus]|jgi:hypothetical protein|uniref:HNH-5 domain-containing protein n=1 Tax=Brevibacillus aydinogluensis TaxID=927786 RepID=A0AA48RJ39_9BACL|nr:MULTISPECIES: hypothetical protein [Brevibacillus]NNV02359.1 hypothetical protein [Brevibacillus sp. MCWH]CAJ1004152.1 HNH-5 domain-containing protein [Brevibacillus aydinogluensis]